MPRYPRQPELDAMRFIAFALVFEHHSRFHSSAFRYVNKAGAFGVCIFFGQ